MTSDDYLAATRQAVAMGLLRAKREALGLTQQQLADLADVEQATLSRWEMRTRVPNGRSLRRLAAALERLESSA